MAIHLPSMPPLILASRTWLAPLSRPWLPASLSSVSRTWLAPSSHVWLPPPLEKRPKYTQKLCAITCKKCTITIKSPIPPKTHINLFVFTPKTHKNHRKIMFFSKNTEILTFFSCILKKNYLNLQNNIIINNKKITLKKYQYE